MSVKLTPTGYYLYTIDPNGKILEKTTSTANTTTLLVSSGSTSRIRAAAWNTPTVDLSTITQPGQVVSNIDPRIWRQGYTNNGFDDVIYIFAVPRNIGVGDNIYDYIPAEPRKSDEEIWTDFGASDDEVSSQQYWLYEYDPGGAYDGGMPEKGAINASKLLLEDYVLLFIMYDEGSTRKATFARYNGSNSSDKSYIEVILEDGSPVIEGIVPSSHSLINPNIEQKISYDLTAPALVTPFDQDWVEGEIVVDEGLAVEKLISTKEHAFTLLPEEMTGETISVRFYANAGGADNTPMTEWLTYITKDGITSAVSLYPVDARVNTAEPVEFAWLPGVQYGDQATRAVLEYSVDQLIWNSLAEVEGSDSTVIVDLSALPGGTIYWRVRTYNANGEAGNWSTPAAITLYGPPQTPAIYSITEDPRPLITWQSPGQVAYQLKIGEVIDTGEVPGTSRTYQIMKYLDKGTYSVRLRIKNNIGVWSAWAESSMEIAFSSPAVPEVTTSASDTSLSIRISNWSEYEKAYLIRDGVVLGKFADGGVYIDQTVSTRQIYTVIAVALGDVWAKNSLNVSFEMPEGFTLDPVAESGGDIWLKLMIDRPREVSRSKTYGGAIVSLLGREYGVRQYSGNNQGSFQVEAAVLDATELSLLYTLADKHTTVLYRDKLGGRSYCAIDQIGESDMFKGNMVVHVVTITMSRVDYVEDIEYDVPEPLTATVLLRMMPQNERRLITLAQADNGATE